MCSYRGWRDRSVWEARGERGYKGMQGDKMSETCAPAEGAGNGARGRQGRGERRVEGGCRSRHRSSLCPHRRCNSGSCAVCNSKRWRDWEHTGEETGDLLGPPHVHEMHELKHPNLDAYCPPVLHANLSPPTQYPTPPHLHQGRELPPLVEAPQECNDAD